MDQTTRTPVQIIQEMIAVHSTRTELAEKIGEAAGTNGKTVTLDKIHRQSQQFTDELMNELSEFGDAVVSSVDKTNEYQELYSRLLGDLSGNDDAKNQQSVQSLEETLKSVYQDYIDQTPDEYESLKELLKKQAALL